MVQHCEDDLFPSDASFCPFNSCPLELLIMVAEYVQRKDLVSLSLVCSSFRTAAQDVLYKEIALVDNVRSCGSFKRNISLLQTLSGRPDLASKVQKLIMYPLRTKFEWFSAEQLAFQRALAPSLGLPGHPDRSCKQKISALLLSLLPRLMVLRVDPTFEGVADRLSFQPLFFASHAEPEVSLWTTWQDSAKPARNISSIAALANITTLAIDSGDVGPPLLTLPNLTKLELGYEAAVRLPSGHPTYSNITMLTLVPQGTQGQRHERSYGLLQGLDAYDRCKLLSALPQLSSLVPSTERPEDHHHYFRLYCSEDSWEEDSIDPFMKCAPNVKSLNLMHGSKDRKIELGQNRRHPELTQYKLHQLMLMEAALMGDSNDSSNASHEPIHCIPRHVQSLTIRHRTSKSFPWLLALCRADFPTLDRIEYRCKRDAEAGFHYNQMCWTVKMLGMVEKLAVKGIQLAVVCDDD